MADDGLWDEEGEKWELAEAMISRGRVERLLDEASKVGVHEDFGRPVRWLALSQGREFWRSQVSANFVEDESDWLAAKQRRAWLANEYRLGDRTLLVFKND